MKKKGKNNSGRVKGWLKSLMEPAEDPRQSFANAYKNQSVMLDSVQNALLDINTIKSGLENKLAEGKSKLPGFLSDAKEVLKTEGEESARLVLQRHQIATFELDLVKRQINEMGQEKNRLSMVEQKLTAQIESFLSRQEMILAQKNAAESEIRINEALATVSEEFADLDSSLEEAESMTKSMKERASHIEEMIETSFRQGFGRNSDLLRANKENNPDFDSLIDEQLQKLIKNSS